MLWLGHLGVCLGMIYSGLVARVVGFGRWKMSGRQGFDEMRGRMVFGGARFVWVFACRPLWPV